MRALRFLLVAALLCHAPVLAHARRPRTTTSAVRVKAHTVRTRRGVRLVAAHHRTRPNARENDNYSTRGKTNPYTGKKGTRRRSPKG